MNFLKSILSPLLLRKAVYDVVDGITGDRYQVKVRFKGRFSRDYADSYLVEECRRSGVDPISFDFLRIES